MKQTEKEVEKIINFIRNYFQEQNLGGIIIGLSGGKDSAVVAALFTKELGKENVIGVSMPCHSKKEDYNDAQTIANYYGFKHICMDLTNTFLPQLF